MKELWKKGKRAILFTAGGALIGLLAYAFAGCTSGACGITSNPFSSMAYMGMIGLLLSGSLSCGCCGGSCNTKPPE